MSWNPWQLAQLATDCDPALDAIPWKDWSKLITRSAGIPNFFDSRTLPWHCAQVSTTFDAASMLSGETLCMTSWQLVQGAPRPVA